MEAKGANRITGKPALTIELTELSYNGKSYRLSSDPFVREGTSRGKRTATTAGGGAALGAIIGAIAGGGSVLQPGRCEVVATTFVVLESNCAAGAIAQSRWDDSSENRSPSAGNARSASI